MAKIERVKEEVSRAYSLAYNKAFLEGWLLESQRQEILETHPDNFVLKNYPTVERVAKLAEEVCQNLNE